MEDHLTEFRYVPESGFMAAGQSGPAKDRPRDWIAWHFTHIANLQAIVESGRIKPPSAVNPAQNVALLSVKQRRQYLVSVDDSYPAASVLDHVPFYFAAKSPMLYAVSRGHADYTGGSDALVFLGARLGDIIDTGATWCASNGNAAAGLTAFSRDLAGLGSFVDFDLLRQRDWYNTADDMDRKRRRAAELLVFGEVPLEMISVVVTKSDAMLQRVIAIWPTVGAGRKHGALAAIYY